MRFGDHADNVQTQRQLLEGNVQWRPTETAFIAADSGKKFNYHDFNNEVNKFANALLNRGVREGDRVGAILHNTIEFPIATYACYKIGAVFTPLNYMLTDSDYEYIFDDLRPSIIIYDSEVSQKVKEAKSDSQASFDTICVGEAPEDVDRFEEVSSSAVDSAPPELSDNFGRLAQISYTSGTTGKPKGAAFTEATLNRKTEETRASNQMSPDDTILIASPWFHTGGLGIVRPGISVGAAVVATMDWSPRSIARIIESHEVTKLVCVPTLAKRLVNLENVDNYDFSSIRALTCMGGPLSEKLAVQLNETLTPNVYNGYGSTETQTDVMLRPADLPEKAGAIGKPTHHTQVRVIKYEPGKEYDPHDTVEIGEVGRIIVKSDAVLDFYWRDKEKTDESFNEGWFYSNDLGVIDEDKYITIAGRADDMVLSGGELVSPVEVEEALEEHSEVSAAVAVGISDEEWGQKVKAYVVAGDVTEDELIQFCRDHDALANYKRPKVVEFVESIERNATGKKQRFQYRGS